MAKTTAKPVLTPREHAESRYAAGQFACLPSDVRQLELAQSRTELEHGTRSKSRDERIVELLEASGVSVRPSSPSSSAKKRTTKKRTTKKRRTRKASKK